MLSEQIKIGIPELKMLQINTDGITVMIPETKKREFYNLCKAWEKQTKLELEYVAYDTMVIRDVNNYLSRSVKGKIKRKGDFVTYEQMLQEEAYHKALSQPIVPLALEKFFLEGVPVEETIMKADNIFDFGKQFNGTAGWIIELIDSDGNVKEQQKTNRYYISTDGDTFRKRKEERIIEIEAGGTKVTIFNEYIKKPIDEYNIDYDYYINECYKIIHKIDGTNERIQQERKALKEKESRDRQESNYVKYCVDKQPTQRQFDLYAKDWLIEKYGKPEIKIITKKGK